MADSDEFHRFRGVCEAAGNDAGHVVAELLSDWADRQESDAPESWDELTKWYENDGSPNAGDRTVLDALSTFRLFKKLCPDLGKARGPGCRTNIPKFYFKAYYPDGIVLRAQFCCDSLRIASPPRNIDAPKNLYWLLVQAIMARDENFQMLKSD